MSITYGENPVLIKEGEHLIGEDCIAYYIKREIIGLPSLKEAYVLITDKILPPIEFIGGKTPRSVGDTCRMYLKIQFLSNPMPFYFFWDGIVDNKFPSVDMASSFEYDYTLSKQQELENAIFKLFQMYITESQSGLCTGQLIHRMVLLEKTRK